MSQETLVRETEVAAFRAAVLAKLTYAVGKDPDHAFDHDWFEAIALAARDHIVEHWMDHTRQIYRKGQKRVYYLSLEFLIGRLLYDSLSNLGLLDIAREALVAPARTRRGAGQRRPGTAGGLFHGEHVDPRHRRPRLWHPL